MKTRRIGILAAAALGILGIAHAAGTRDLWSQARGNASNTGVAACANVVEPVEAWRTPPTAGTDTRVPVPFRGRVYVPNGTSGLASVDAATGLTQWSFSVPGEVFAMTPACVSYQGVSYVFAAAQASGSRIRIYALRENADTPGVVWSQTLSGDLIQTASLTYADRRLYFTARVGIEATLLVLDARNGNTLYTYDGGGTLQFGTRLAVDPATGSVCLAGWDNQDIHCVDASGNLLWRASGMQTPFISLVLDPGTRRLLLYGTSPTDTVRCLDAATGARLWDSGDLGIRTSPSGRAPVVFQGRVFFRTSDGRTVAVDLATGEPLWSSPLGGGHMLASGNGTLWIQDAVAGRLYGLEAATGATVTDLAFPGGGSDLGCEDRSLFGFSGGSLVKLQGR